MNTEEIQKLKDIVQSNSCVIWNPNCREAEQILRIEEGADGYGCCQISRGCGYLFLKNHDLSEFVIGNRL